MLQIIRNFYRHKDVSERKINGYKLWVKNIAPKIQKDVSLETGSSWGGGQRMGRQSAFWVVGVDFRGLGLRESW